MFTCLFGCPHGRSYPGWSAVENESNPERRLAVAAASIGAGDFLLECHPCALPRTLSAITAHYTDGLRLRLGSLAQYVSVIDDWIDRVHNAGIGALPDVDSATLACTTFEACLLCSLSRPLAADFVNALAGGPAYGRDSVVSAVLIRFSGTVYKARAWEALWLPFNGEGG